MIDPSSFIAINADGTGVLADGRHVRLFAGRNNIILYRPLEVESTARAALAVGGVDQVGARPVPTMQEALGG